MFERIKRFFSFLSDDEYIPTEEEIFWEKYFEKVKGESWWDIKDNDDTTYPISKATAIDIASENQNLKSDFLRNTTYRHVSWLSFNDFFVKLVEVNNRKYWNIQVCSADISHMYYNYEEDSTYHSDGWVGEENLAKLSCLIDVQTGEYIYSPKENLPGEGVVNMIKYKDRSNQDE